MRLKTAKAILKDELVEWDLDELVKEYNRLLGLNDRNIEDLINLIMGFLSRDHIIARSKEIVAEEDEEEDES